MAAASGAVSVVASPDPGSVFVTLDPGSWAEADRITNAAAMPLIHRRQLPTMAFLCIVAKDIWLPSFY
jgi:hypothetical protein